jgi:ribosome biogenesis GTPase
VKTATDTTSEGTDPVLPGEALVVAITRGQCEVEMGGEIVLCHLPKALALVQKSDLAVGDRLRVARRSSGELVVAQVLPRRSRLSRPDPLLAHRERVLAANLDLAVVVTALRKPALATGLLDRFLVALAHGGVPAAVVVNKYDLAETPGGDTASDPELARLAPYRALRIPFLFCSAKSGLGIEELRTLLSGKTVVVGYSGCRQTILALSPELDVRVRGVGDELPRPMTTRESTSRERTRIIDARHPGSACGKLDREEPGLREFEPSQRCRFNDCSHSHEPNCAVGGRSGSDLDAGRYEPFGFSLRSARASRRRRQSRLPDAEPGRAEQQAVAGHQRRKRLAGRERQDDPQPGPFARAGLPGNPGKREKRQRSLRLDQVGKALTAGGERPHRTGAQRHPGSRSGVATEEPPHSRVVQIARNGEELAGRSRGVREAGGLELRSPFAKARRRAGPRDLRRDRDRSAQEAGRRPRDTAPATGESSIGLALARRALRVRGRSVAASCSTRRSPSSGTFANRIGILLRTFAGRSRSKSPLRSDEEPLAGGDRGEDGRQLGSG